MRASPHPVFGEGTLFGDVGFWYVGFSHHVFNLPPPAYARFVGISCEFLDSVAVLTWDDGENRVNLDSLGRLNALLDELEQSSGQLAVVLTGVGKFFSNGLDLERFANSPTEFADTLTALHRTVGRILIFPAYTVAAINGHCFAAGALLSCAFDYRVMREDRGYWCMNEAEIGLALDEKLWRILTNRLPRATAIAAATTARRYGGGSAREAGVVEAVAPGDNVIADALAYAAHYVGLDRSILSAHKRLAHGDTARFLGFSA